MSDEIIEQAEIEVLDSPAVETDVEQPEVDTDQPEVSEQQEDRSDGRALPRDVQKALKALRENPETAKVARALNDSYFREQAYSKHGKPADVAAAFSAIERMGGYEGIEKVEQQLESMRIVDQDIADGNPEFLEDIIKTSPDGFKKLVGPSLVKLYNLDKEAYGRVVAPPIFNTLKAYQIPQLVDSLRASQDPAAKAVHDQLSRLLADLDEEVRKSPVETKNPEADRLKQDRENLYQEKGKMELQGVGSKTLSYQNDLVSKNLNPLLKTRTLSADSRKDLQSGISSEVERLLREDTEYQNHVSAAVKRINETVRTGGSTQKLKDSLVRFINSKMDEAAPRAVKTVWSRRGYGAAAPARRVAAPAPKNTKPPAQKDYWSMSEAEREAWRASRPS